MNIENYLKIYDEYFDLVCSIAYEKLKDYHLAGDVAQDVFLELLKKREELDASKIKYWVVLNANRRAIDYLRRSYHKHEVESTDNKMSTDEGRRIGSSDVQPEQRMLRQEREERCCSILEKLEREKPRWYHILMDYHIGGRNYKEMAKDYKTSEAYLRVEASRARHWLRKRIEQAYRED